MTTDELKRLDDHIAALKQYRETRSLDGIEFLALSDRKWYSLGSFPTNKFYWLRLKPQPRVIPWTMETCPVGKVIHHMSGGKPCRSIITQACDDRFYYGLANVAKYSEVIQLKMDDGSPCGVEEVRE